MKIYTVNNFQSIVNHYREISLFEWNRPSEIYHKGKKWYPIVQFEGKINEKKEKALRIQLIVLAILTLGIYCCTRQYKDLNNTLKTKKEVVIVAADHPFPDALRTTVLSHIPINLFSRQNNPRNIVNPPLANRNEEPSLPPPQKMPLPPQDVQTIEPEPPRSKTQEEIGRELYHMFPYEREDGYTERQKKLKNIIDLIGQISNENIDNFFNPHDCKTLIHQVMIYCSNYCSLEKSKEWFFPIIEVLLYKKASLIARKHDQWPPHVDETSLEIIDSIVNNNYENGKELIKIILKYRPALKEHLLKILAQARKAPDDFEKEIKKYS